MMMQAETRQSDRDFEQSQDMFIKKYGIEFQNVPPHLRQRVAYLIDLKVEREVQEQMDEFKTEVWGELNDQR
jgi:hypothetical protein